MRATVPPCGVCRDLEPPQSLRKNVSSWPRAGTEKKVAFGIEREAPLALYAGGTVEIQKTSDRTVHGFACGVTPLESWRADVLDRLSTDRYSR